MTHLPYYVAAWLLVVGLYGVVTSRHLVHLIICLTVVQSSTYVLLLTIGYRAGAAAPVFVDIPPGTPAVDYNKVLDEATAKFLKEKGDKIVLKRYAAE